VEVLIHGHTALFQVGEFFPLKLHGATRHIVGAETSLELIPGEGVNVRMGIVVRLPPVGCCSIELVCSKTDLLVISALAITSSFQPP
jgi:hypothetical protein